MKTIELFCGTKSFSKVAEELGHKIWTTDNDPQFNPSLVKDIFDLSSLDIPANVDIMWCSPPCTCFSVASISHHWTGGSCAYIPKTKEAVTAKHIIQKTIQLIQNLAPTYWFIENPRGVLRKMPFMIELEKDTAITRHTVTYCQYGDDRMKPTDIWTNVPKELWTPKPMCKNGSPCHVSAPRGSRTGTQGLGNAIDRSRIPSNLFKEIFNAL